MKKKIKKQIPGYAYGANEITGAITNGLAATIPYATSGKATVGTALGGMASGAAAGSALGGYGALAGAAVGGIMGSIGTGGSVDEMTGEITNPSGIAGLFGHSKGYLRRKSNRIKNSNIGRQLTENLRADYYNNSMAEYNPNTFAQGGTVGDEATIRMSKGEIAQDKLTKETYSPSPDAQPNGKDDVIVNAHVGDSIMSNKRKDIDKSMTNAQWAKKFIKPNKKSTDKYAQGTLDAQNLLWQIGINKQEEAKVNKNIGRYSDGTPKVEIEEEIVEEDPIPNADEWSEWAKKKIARKEKINKFFSGLANSLPQIAQLSAPIINMAKSKEPAEKPVAHTISPTYGRTTVDNRPLLRQIGTTDAITRYNASNLGGAGQAYALQSALNTNRSLADIWSDTYNKEITLASQNAAIANRVKEFNSQVMHTADVEYAQNKAARDNMWTTGVGQLGQMIGGIGRDLRGDKNNAALAFALSPYLRQGMVNEDVDRLFNILGYSA